MSLRGTLDVMAATLQRATSVPMTASCVVNRAEQLALVDQARAGIPVEIREAALVLAQREDILVDARREAELMLADAQHRAANLVETSRIAADARRRADEILEAATAEAQRLARDADDYCDRRLAALEVELERVLSQVRGGRRRLTDRRDGPGAARDINDLIDITDSGAGGEPPAGSRIGAAPRHASARGAARPGRRVLDLTAAEQAEQAEQAERAEQVEQAEQAEHADGQAGQDAPALHPSPELGRGGDLQ